MLAEKFFLRLEALLSSKQYPDGSPRVKSTSPHVRIELPIKNNQRIIDKGRAAWAAADMAEGSDVVQALYDSDQEQVVETMIALTQLSNLRRTVSPAMTARDFGARYDAAASFV
jgi:hypothetical protein